MPIQATRALLHAALSGRLEDVEYRTDEVFGFEVPVSVPGVERSLLDPRSTWRDPDAYDAKARELAQMFRENFKKFEDVEPEVAEAARWSDRVATSVDGGEADLVAARVRGEEAQEPPALGGNGRGRALGQSPGVVDRERGAPGVEVAVEPPEGAAEAVVEHRAVARPARADSRLASPRR